MSWSQYARARQLLVEEHIGVFVRAAAREESSSFERSAEALKRQQRALLGVEE